MTRHARLAHNQLAGSVYDFRRLLAGSRAALRPLQEVVDQLGAGIAHLHVEGFNLVR